MRIFLPFTWLRAATFLACPRAILVPLLDDNDYARYFQARWAEGCAFINVEHDVVPSAKVLESLWACPAKMCVTGYKYAYWPDQAPEITFLGCVKIGARLIKESPGLFDDFPCWSSCDGYITRAANEQYCYHGEVLHLK